jgi:hypothetical protein
MNTRKKSAGPAAGPAVKALAAEVTTAAVRLCLIAALVLLQVSCGGCSLPLEARPPETLSILSYNVENLFDDVGNGSEYREFDPAHGEWTTDLFHRKLLAVSQALLHTPRGGADILLLQEVENLNALETLRDHYLKGAGYRYLAISDEQGSAVELACLSRYPIVSVRAHHAYIDGLRQSRPVLECRIDVGGIPINLLVNHWKSKYGGAEETEPLRIAAASVVSRRLWELFEGDPGQEVIVAGDLNERTDEYEQVEEAYLTALMPAEAAAAAPNSLCLTADPGLADGVSVLFSPWLGCESETQGSYYYGGEWEQIDHFLFGPGLFDGRGFDFDSFSVVATEMLLNRDGKPYAWSRHSGTGFSDHLPILLKLETVGN